MSIADYLTALNNQRGALADNLNSMGVTAQRSEKLNTLVPKVLQIAGGGSARLQDKTAYQNGIVLPDTGYDGLSSVTVSVAGGGGDGAGAHSILRVTISDPAQATSLRVTKDGVTAAPVNSDGNVFKFFITECGTWSVETEHLSQGIEIPELYFTYSIAGDAPQLWEGVYYVSRDQGDYATWSNRQITRVYPGGTPLLVGLAKNSNGYACPVFASAVDLGGKANVISGSFADRRVGTFSDGTDMFLYGGFSGGYQDTTVKIFNSAGTLLTTIGSGSPRLNLPYPTGRMSITCNEESLLNVVESVIRLCGGSQNE